MIEKLENMAATLIPKRKWFLIAFLISFIGSMPAAVGLMILFKNPIFFFLGSFVSVLGFTWSWGLFLISYWYIGGLHLTQVGGWTPLYVVVSLNDLTVWQRRRHNCLLHKTIEQHAA